jgi:putative membrane protein
MRSDPAESSRRLHPASLLFSIGSAARRLLLPGLVVLVASRGSNAELWFMLFFAPAAVVAVVRYLTYRWRLEPEELVVREGVVTRTERHIPYDRIQNVDLVQNPLHRLFGVAEVRLETAGGQEPEAVIRVLALEAGTRIRERVFAGRRARAAPPPGSVAPAEPLAEPAPLLVHRMSPREILLFGVISNRGMLVVAALVGALWPLEPIERLSALVSPELVERVRQLKAPGSPLRIALLGAAGVVLIVLLMRGLSVVWAFLELYGFRLQRQDDDLRAEYGLLTRVSKTIPRHRIQTVAIQDGVLHRLFGRSSVQLETAGSSDGGDGSRADRLWLAPLVRRDVVPALVRGVFPDIDLDTLAWQPISLRTPRRMIRVPLALLVLAAAAAAWWIGAWALAPAAALGALVVIHARLYCRHTRWAIGPTAVFHRCGFWLRCTTIVPFNKIQSLERADSPFDRRHRMAAVRIDTAGGGKIGSHVDLSFLEATVADRLFEQLAWEAGRAPFRWR